MALPSSQSEDMISGINVTPLVDVVLVLLVVLMVTATYIASRAIPVDLPSGKTGEVAQAPLAISVDKQGGLFLDGAPINESDLHTRLRAARARSKDLRAVIAADGSVRQFTCKMNPDMSVDQKKHDAIRRYFMIKWPAGIPRNPEFPE